jgi:rhodanese-related sulfurtransferase
MWIRRRAEASSPTGIIIMADAAARPIVEDVSLQDLKAGLADGSIILIDVREPHEYAVGHIKGSSLNPLQSFDPAALPPAESGKRIVFSCRSGRRSISALGLAQQAGRSDIRAHYPGGILGWEGAGEPVENFEDSL